MFINLRSGLKTASHISYLLGVLSIVLAMTLSLVNFPVAAQTLAPELTAGQHMQCQLQQCECHHSEYRW